MATSRYTLDITLPSGHTNGITALQFSPDGRFLASGSGDGVLLVFSTSTWKPVKQFVDISSVSTLVWHPAIPKTIISGYASVTSIPLGLRAINWLGSLAPIISTALIIQQDDEGSKVWTDCMGGQVHRITIDKTGTKIAIAYGVEVVVLDQNTLCESSADFSGARRQPTCCATASWTNARNLPDPPSLPGLDEQLPTPTANSLHFINEGKALIVSYSDHGIVYEGSLLPRFDSNECCISCWDTDSLGVKWHITPRACSM